MFLRIKWCWLFISESDQCWMQTIKYEWCTWIVSELRRLHLTFISVPFGLFVTVVFRILSWNDSYLLMIVLTITVCKLKQVPTCNANACRMTREHCLRDISPIVPHTDYRNVVLHCRVHLILQFPQVKYHMTNAINSIVMGDGPWLWTSLGPWKGLIWNERRAEHLISAIGKLCE